MPAGRPGPRYRTGDSTRRASHAWERDCRRERFVGGVRPDSDGERQAHRKLDDEGLPLPPPAEGRAVSRWMLTIMEGGETVLCHRRSALALLGELDGHLFSSTGSQQTVAVTERPVRAGIGALSRSPGPWTPRACCVIVVVLELLRTIVARLEGGGFQLQPFLVIGIISATRDILTVGAELSLGQVPVSAHRDRTGRQRGRGRRPGGGASAGAALRAAGTGVNRPGTR